MEVSIIIPVYKNTDSDILDQRLALYDNMPEELKNQFQIIIVDDGSPSKIVLPQVNLNVTLLRILEDIPWNQSGASNLGICYASTQKIMLTDIDHFIPQKTMEFIVNKNLLLYDVIKFKRMNNGNKVRIHPNTFLIRKDFFMRMNLYDEDFSGNYGYNDIFATDFSFIKYNADIQTSNHYVEVISANEHNLIRDTKINEQKLKEKNGQHSKKILQFTWEFVDERYCIGKNTHSASKKRWIPKILWNIWK